MGKRAATQAQGATSAAATDKKKKPKVGVLVDQQCAICETKRDVRRLAYLLAFLL